MPGITVSANSYVRNEPLLPAPPCGDVAPCCAAISRGRYAFQAESGFIPTPPPSKGGALAPLGVSSDLAHLRVWAVGWGNVPLVFCGVLVGESRATSLAGARWGLSPG
jgi:hypothetical protein